MVYLILIAVAAAVAWKFLKAKGGTVTIPPSITVGNTPAQIDVHAALQLWEDTIAKAARDIEVKTLAEIKAKANIQARAEEASKVAESVAPKAP